ncbi:MAG: MBL fold metallo-hydrolase [Elusimicrobiota bacterium]
MIGNKVKISFLGISGWYDSELGNTVCSLIETKDAYIVLDAGFGIAKLDQYIKDKNKKIYLFLSHFHIDHICGLHVLCKFNFRQGITIVGQKGTREVLNTFLAPIHSVPLRKLSYPVKIVEVLPGWYSQPVSFQCLPLRHSVKCYGYRFVVGGKVVSYCTDTGYCKNVLRLCDKADLAVLECSFRPGEKSKEWPHLNPETVVRIAEESDINRSVMIHFDPSRYDVVLKQKVVSNSSRQIVDGKDNLNVCI